jgi:O-antigen/teichoic acid export membrane protein
MSASRYAQTFFARTAVAVLAIVNVILTSRALGAAGRGEIALIGATVGIAGVLAGFVGGPTVVYLVPRQRLRAILVPTYIWLSLVAAGTVVASRWFGLVPAYLVIHAGLLALLSAANGVHAAIVVGQQSIARSNLISLAGAIVGVVTNVVTFIVLHRTTVLAALVANYVTVLVGVVGNVLVTKRSAAREPASWHQVAANVRLSIVAQVGTLAQFLNYRLSFYVLNVYAGTAEVGVYSIATVAAESIWLLASSISLVHYSDTANSPSREASIRRTIKLARMSALGTVVMVTAIILLPTELFGAVLGREFGRVRPVIALMGPGIVAFAYGMILSHFFSGTGKYVMNTIAAAAGLAMTALTAILLIPRWREAGAAVGASVTYLTIVVIQATIFARDTGVRAREMLPSIGDMKELLHVVARLRTANPSQKQSPKPTNT